MSYNQKVWLGVLLFCSLFWLTVANSLYSLSKKIDKHQQEQTVKTTPAQQKPPLAQAP